MVNSSRLFSAPQSLKLLPKVIPKVETKNGCGHLLQFKRDERLAIDPQYAWQIESGYVRKVTMTFEGDLIPFGIWGPGDLLLLVPDSRVAAYEAECLTEVKAARVSINQEELFATMALQIHQLETFLQLLHCNPISQRLLQFLEWLAVRFGFPSEDHDVLRNHWGYTLDLGLTHQAIAESIGSTRVTVTRLLNQFEAQKKLVKLSRQKIFLQMPIHVQN